MNGVTILIDRVSRMLDGVLNGVGERHDGAVE
jgi:hypothetical protein